MSRDPNDVVRVFTGPLVEVEANQQVLTEAGIESKVVGTELTASFGTALSGSIELWVHAGDAENAVAAIRRDQEQRGRHEEREAQPHPTNSPKPTQAPRGKEPHVKQDPLGE